MARAAENETLLAQANASRFVAPTQTQSVSYTVAASNDNIWANASFCAKTPKISSSSQLISAVFTSNEMEICS